jgi:hypothetical protein
MQWDGPERSLFEQLRAATEKSSHTANGFE